jgi:hypothetical protein
MERAMTCKDIEIMLIEKMFGKLSVPDGARLEEHLRTCPACRRLAGRSPDLSGQLRADDDIPLPDKEAAWQAILSRTARERSRVPAVFWKWAAATAGLAAIVLLAVLVGRNIFFRPGETPGPLSAGARSPFSGYAEGVEMVLLSALNGTGGEDLSNAEGRLLGDLLVQTRMLKQVIARYNDLQTLKLIDDIEMILTDLAHLRAGDKESRGFLNRKIEEKDMKFRLKLLSGVGVKL